MTIQEFCLHSLHKEVVVNIYGKKGKLLEKTTAWKSKESKYKNSVISQWQISLDRKDSINVFISQD